MDAFYTTEDIVVPAGTMVGTMRLAFDKDNFLDFATVDIGRWDDAVKRGRIVQRSDSVA